MFCPECRAEYREGFTVCADCNIGLVPTLPEALPGQNDERPDMELATVFDSTNPALIGIAKTVLESAGIEFLVVGEDGARVFSGNPFLGRVRLQVEKKLAEEAEALLSEISESEEPLQDEPPLIS
ncbi:MAG: hypothetical protein BMS9Abin37_2160 [Acidobacteriota bacterium]|nr:MAG: hypothetical protein BMS9Abin37_2160 [Acidobacteriota bacterium]